MQVSREGGNLDAHAVIGSVPLMASILLGDTMKKLIGLVAVTVMLGGCLATGQKITKLDPGAGRGAVLQVLGRPDAVRVSGDHLIYTYLHRHRTRHSPGHTDYTVILKNNHVVQFGPGHARRAGMHSWVIEPPMD